ncbi:SH3 domain-containing protein, partial [Gilliamella sp. B3000]
MALAPIKKWKYPVVTNDPKKSSAARYHQALMLAQTGFYPVSVNKLVHGGIHFDEDVLKNLGIVNDKPSKVYCIADGEVIAYRVNDNYQKVDYGDKVSFFSTGFVLVRHLLEMERIEEATPPATPTPTTESQSSPDAATTNSTENSTAPAANALPSSNTQPTTTTPVKTSPTGTNTNTPTTTGDASTASTPPATETAKPKQSGHQLYFYSLYMHLADTKFYNDNPKEPTPAFWEQDIYRVTEKGLDFVEGLNIRKKPDLKKGEILAVLQAGTKVELNLELHTEDYKWYAVTSLKEGYCSIPVLTPYEHEGKKIIGWVFNGTQKQLTESEFDIKDKDKDKDKNFAKSKGLRVRDESKKNILSMLPKGTQVKISGKKKPKTFVELAQIVRDGQPTIPLSEGKKLVWSDNLENITRGKEYNQVVVLDKPYPIKAGDLVGHIGHNQNKGISKQKDKDGNYIEMATLPLKTGLTASQYKPSLHVECFTCDDLPTFITQTQTEAGKIPDEDKTLVGISKGAKLLASASESDTKVGECLKGSEIKILSKERNINWFQIEIQTSKSETKTLWIENNKEIQDKLKEKGNLKDLASTTKAWSKFPLQQSELTTSKKEVDTPPLLLNLNDEDLIKNDKRAMDEKGTLWLWIEHAVDSQNVPIKGWTFIGSEGVKKVSGWEWFGFKQITETGSLKEFYLSAKKSETRNKDNASLENYKPTLKETLTILDKQYIQNSNKYATLTQGCFKGISEKPHLTTALGRLLVHYQSEWYEELDAEGKRP